jgi:hypothetical protein
MSTQEEIGKIKEEIEIYKDLIEDYDNIVMTLDKKEENKEEIEIYKELIEDYKEIVKGLDRKLKASEPAPEPVVLTLVTPELQPPTEEKRALEKIKESLINNESAMRECGFETTPSTLTPTPTS